MAEHPATSEYWDWTSGVFMFALTELYRVTGDSDVHDYYKEYMDFQIAEGYRLYWSDSCPPALTALALWSESGEGRYRKVVDDVLDYLRTAPRTEDGGISHYGNIYPTIWVDSLFMFGMVLNRQGELADDEASLALMSEQLGIFSDVLQADDGLLVHADKWSEPFDTDVYWGRGNGWVAAAMAEVLASLPADQVDRPVILASYRKMMRALLRYQGDDGLWRQVIDLDTAWGESSATAMIAYAMAVGIDHELLPDATYRPAVDAAWRGLTALIDDAGNVGEVCVGTGKKNDLQYYLDRPRVAGDFHGQAPVLWLAAELLRAGS
jgi:unsaturated rhamnogalacturonyl hydrolase